MTPAVTSIPSHLRIYDSGSERGDLGEKEALREEYKAQQEDKVLPETGRRERVEMSSPEDGNRGEALERMVAGGRQGQSHSCSVLALGHPCNACSAWLLSQALCLAREEGPEWKD